MNLYWWMWIWFLIHLSHIVITFGGLANVFKSVVYFVFNCSCCSLMRSSSGLQAALMMVMQRRWTQSRWAHWPSDMWVHVQYVVCGTVQWLLFIFISSCSHHNICRSFSEPTSTVFCSGPFLGHANHSIAVLSSFQICTAHCATKQASNCLCIDCRLV